MFLFDRPLTQALLISSKNIKKTAKPFLLRCFFLGLALDHEEQELIHLDSCDFNE